MSSNVSKIGVIVMGPPGSGKGTQVSRIGRRFDNVEVVVMSDLLKVRDEVKGMVNSGALVPDDVVNHVLRGRLNRVLIDDRVDVVVFDGFPRTLGQAFFLDALVDVKLVVMLSVSEKIILSRLSSRLVCNSCSHSVVSGDHADEGDDCCVCNCGKLVKRVDDLNELAVKHRMATYEKQVGGLIDFYREKVVEINAEADISEVEAWIGMVLSEFCMGVL